VKIGIDARFWGPTKTGIGRYVFELVTHLERIDKENEYVIFLQKEDFENVEFESPRFKKVLADFPIYSLSEQIKFPLVLRRERLDLLHVPHFNAPVFYLGDFVVTIHDLIKHKFKSRSTTTRNPIRFWLSQFVYYLVFSSAINRSKKIITPSAWVKKEVQIKFHQDDKKIVVTYEAPAENLKKIAQLNWSSQKVASVLKNYRLAKPYLLYVGNLYPHKNIDKLIEALEQIPSAKLVIVTARNVFLKKAKKRFGEYKAFNRVKFLGFIPDADLPAIYKGAEVFVFPSLSEGFGLPGIEAMAFGTPVAAADNTALPEVYDEAAIYFDPNDSDDIAQRINQVLTDKDLAESLSSRGQAWARTFSWTKTARATLDIYNESRASS